MLMSLFYYMCVGLGSTSAGFAESANDFWIAKIRKEHPRLFFNKDTWPQVRERALHQEEDWYVSLKKRVDSYPDNPTSESQRDDFAYRQTGDGEDELIKLPRPTEWGSQAMETAFIYLMTGERKYLEKSRPEHALRGCNR